MRFDRLITLGLTHPVRRTLSGPPVGGAAAPLPVLMYHSISDDAEPRLSPYYKVCTSPRRFAEHMQWLADAGWRGVTLREGLAAMAEHPKPSRVSSVIPGKHSEKLVAITFDDGFRDFHTEAFPALQRHGFTATMYLPTNFIGEDRQHFKDRECLTWAEARELAAAGTEFGSHTASHPVLVSLDRPAIERELQDSQAALGRGLGFTPSGFAYPYAFPQEDRRFTDALAGILQRFGYDYCATTIVGRVHPGDDPFRLRRLPANTLDDRALLLAKLAGAYDWLAVPQSASRHLKYCLKRRSTAS